MHLDFRFSARLPPVLYILVEQIFELINLLDLINQLLIITYYYQLLVICYSAF